MTKPTYAERIAALAKPRAQRESYRLEPLISRLAECAAVLNESTIRDNSWETKKFEALRKLDELLSEMEQGK